MRLVELELTHFGKFTKKRIQLQPGVNIIYGGNETGKSTIHAFIRDMLYDIGKGRIRAGKTDEYMLRQPWENPAWFAGKLWLEKDGEIFRLERNFNKNDRSTVLVCETSGQELSWEEHLPRLLGGLSENAFVNTVYLSQNGAATDEGLSEELRQFMLNMRESGDASLDVRIALDQLKRRRQAVERDRKERRKRLDSEIEQCDVTSDYLRRDLKGMEEQEAELERQLAEIQKKAAQTEMDGSGGPSGRETIGDEEPGRKKSRKRHLIRLLRQVNDEQEEETDREEFNKEEFDREDFYGEELDEEEFGQDEAGQEEDFEEELEELLDPNWIDKLLRRNDRRKNDGDEDPREDGRYPRGGGRSRQESGRDRRGKDRDGRNSDGNRQGNDRDGWDSDRNHQRADRNLQEGNGRKGFDGELDLPLNRFNVTDTSRRSVRAESLRTGSRNRDYVEGTERREGGFLSHLLIVVCVVMLFFALAGSIMAETVLIRVMMICIFILLIVVMLLIFLYTYDPERHHSSDELTGGVPGRGHRQGDGRRAENSKNGKKSGSSRYAAGSAGNSLTAGGGSGSGRSAGSGSESRWSAGSGSGSSRSAGSGSGSSRYADKRSVSIRYDKDSPEGIRYDKGGSGNSRYADKRSEGRRHTENGSEESKYAGNNSESSVYAEDGSGSSRYADNNSGSSRYADGNSRSSRYADGNSRSSRYADNNSGSSRYADNNTGSSRYADNNTGNRRYAGNGSGKKGLFRRKAACEIRERAGDGAEERQDEQYLAADRQNTYGQEEQVRLAALREEIARKQASLAASEARKTELCGQRDRLGGFDREVEAIDLASMRIRELSARIVQEVGISFNHEASEILAELTEGRYTAIALDDKMQVRVNTPDKLLFLSQVSFGTMNQIYFALRMAAGEMLGGAELPIILDEAFSMYDDDRLEAVLRWLEFSGRQVILFTCHTREKLMIDRIRADEV